MSVTLWNKTLIRSWLVCVCDTVWNKTLIRSWLVYVCDTVWNKTLMRSWLVYVCDTVWNKTLIRYWLVYVCDTAWNKTLISFFFNLPTDAQKFCFKRNMKIYIKNAPTCFDLITIIRERAIWALLKLLLLKKSESSVKIYRCGQFGGVVAYIIRFWLVYVCDTVWNKSPIPYSVTDKHQPGPGKSLIPNSVTDIHQPEPDNICDHTTELTTTLYFNWRFWFF